MSTDPNSEKATHASLWQALCWIAYDNFDVHEPVDEDRTENEILHEELTLAFNTECQKAALLEAICDGKVRFEGRLGVRCDPPPSLSDTWREYRWAGHVEAHSPIEPQDWPRESADTAIDWTASILRTPRGEFVDVRAARDSVRSWHPGPQGEPVPAPGQAPPPAAEADSALRAGAVSTKPVPAPVEPTEDAEGLAAETVETAVVSASERPERQNKPGRPSRQAEIETAYKNLREKKLINYSEPKGRVYPQIRDQIEKPDDGHRRGLGDEAIRKVISTMFDSEKAMEENSSP